MIAVIYTMTLSPWYFTREVVNQSSVTTHLPSHHTRFNTHYKTLTAK